MPKSANANNSNIATALGSFVWPLCLGLVACAGFYALIHAQVIHDAFVVRYFAGHPVEYVETAMAFVGLAALLLQTLHIVRQFATVDRIDLGDIPEGGQPIDDIPQLLDSLASLPASIKNSYLARRLGDALRNIRRTGVADDVGEDLKYLSDMDAARQHEGFALVRIIIWATPMLGFLGTVIGITLALGDLSPEALVNDPEAAMQGLLAGLSVAFDTTALALSLSIVLMFAQFLVNKMETELLAMVDSKASAQLIGRFQTTGTRTDPQLASINQMARSVTQATERLVYRQAEIWKQSFEQSQQQWRDILNGVGQRLKSDLAEALQQSVQQHARALNESEAAVRHRFEGVWKEMLAALNENLGVLQNQQTVLAKQGDTMLKAARATGEVIRLESALNNNLRALSGSRNFEEMVLSLSAAIQLLSARLGDATAQGGGVRLDSPQDKEQAA